jgi:hypothetical protein
MGDGAGGRPGGSLPLRRRGSKSRWPPVVVPGAVGLALLLAGSAVKGVVLLAVAGAVAVLALAGAPVERWVARFGSWVAGALSVALSSALGAALVLFGGVLRLARRDPIRGGWRTATHDVGRWASVAPPSPMLSAKQFAADGSVVVGSRRASLGHRVVTTIGVVVVVLAVNFAAGWAWDSVFPSSVIDTTARDSINLTGKVTTFDDPRAHGPAMADYPWAEAFFREAQSTPFTYWPFTESRPLEYHGKYVNVDGWDRRTYRPAGVTPSNAPVVWMFGGSTTWGEGQRDEYTIASYIARASEAAGSPVIVRNYGQRGWTHFQEMILFEQLLASQPRPDLAIFYDGANEINAQSLSAKGVPTHTLVDDYAAKISGGISAQVRGSEQPDVVGDAWHAYTRHSAVHKLVRGIDDLVSPDAGASTSVGTVRATSDYTKTIQDAKNAVDVYERGRSITNFLARSHHVDPIFFWQPVIAGPAEDWANAHMSRPTVNISHLLDHHQEVFLDGGHTNEHGADLVARRIWQQLEPRVSAWYRRHPDGVVRRTPVTTTTAPPTTTTLDDHALVEQTVAELDRARTDPCALLVVSLWLPSLRAAAPQEVRDVAGVVVTYLDLVAEEAPVGATDAANTLRTAARAFAGLAQTSSYDPAQPFLPQMQSRVAPGLIASIQTISDSLRVRCSATPAGG